MVARLIQEARAELPDLQLDEVDITEHPEVAVRYRVMSTPAIAINGTLEFLGVPKADALLERLRAAASR
ncbi:MAG: thioredoxin family protein [Candidatus Rokubacteria bacterium]|nr:thioredoxin family protein [Candidatus Rokubacteria bacterium]